MKAAKKFHIVLLCST